MSATARCSTRGFLDGLDVEAAKRRVDRGAGAARRRRAARPPTACATGASRASATGAARSRSSIATTAASCRCRASSCRSTLPEDVDFDRPGNPLDRHPTWKHVACPAAAARRGARPTPSTPSSRAPGTSRASARRTREAPFDRERGRLLAAGRPVYRRGRARRPAPALLALLHPGVEGAAAISTSTSRSPACSRRAWSRTRPSGTRPATGSSPTRSRATRPGAGSPWPTAPAGDRRPRREDEQVQAQHGRPDGDHRHLRRRHGAAVHAVRQPARARPRMDRRRHRRRLALSQPALAPGRRPRAGACRPSAPPPASCARRPKPRSSGWSTGRSPR